MTDKNFLRKEDCPDVKKHTKMTKAIRADIENFDKWCDENVTPESKLGPEDYKWKYEQKRCPTCGFWSMWEKVR